jgi:hypothetical protein
MKKLFCLMLLGLGLVIGCSTPRYDASNPDSIKAVVSGLSEQEKQRVAGAIMVCTMQEQVPQMMQSAFSQDKKPPEKPKYIAKKLDGMTAKEILAWGKDFADKMKESDKVEQK